MSTDQHSLLPRVQKSQFTGDHIEILQIDKVFSTERD